MAARQCPASMDEVMPLTRRIHGYLVSNLAVTCICGANAYCWRDDVAGVWRLKPHRVPKTPTPEAPADNGSPPATEEVTP